MNDSPLKIYFTSFGDIRFGPYLAEVSRFMRFGFTEQAQFVRGGMIFSEV